MKQPNALVVIAGDFNPLSTGLKPKDLTQSNHLKQIVKYRNLRLVSYKQTHHFSTVSTTKYSEE